MESSEQNKQTSKIETDSQIQKTDICQWKGGVGSWVKQAKELSKKNVYIYIYLTQTTVWCLPEVKGVGEVEEGKGGNKWWWKET